MSMDFLPSTEGKQYTGACHCGAVKIEMQGPLYPLWFVIAETVCALLVLLGLLQN